MIYTRLDSFGQKNRRCYSNNSYSWFTLSMSIALAYDVHESSWSECSLVGECNNLNSIWIHLELVNYSSLIELFDDCFCYSIVFTTLPETLVLAMKVFISRVITAVCRSARMSYDTVNAVSGYSSIHNLYNGSIIIGK